MGESHNHHEHVDDTVAERANWARRRREGIPTNKNLLVIACMDERIPVEDVLGLELGDAQIYRNAGGKVTDDVIRSAALTTNFFETDEIIVINHTDCGMMSAPTRPFGRDSRPRQATSRTSTSTRRCPNSLSATPTSSTGSK